MLRVFNRLYLLAIILLLGACAVSPDANVSSAQDKHQALAEEELPVADFPPQVLYQLLVAEVAGQRGQLNIAVSSYLAAAKESQDPSIAARAVRIAMFSQALSEALEAAQLWVRLDPDSSDAQRMVAPLLLAFGRAPEAQQHYERYIALSGDKPDRGFMQIAKQLSRDKNGVAALSVMDKLVEKNKNFSYAWLGHAQLAMQQTKLTLALQSVDRALDLESHWAQAVVVRARILALQGDKEGAIEYLDNEREGDLENNIQVGLSYARLLTETRQIKKARSEFERLVAVEPNNAEILYAAGVLALQLEDFDQAEKHLLSVLRMGQRMLEANFYLGRMYEKKGDVEKALPHFFAVRHGELYLSAQARAASLLAGMGKLAQAREHLHTIRVSNDQEKVRLYLVEGELLRKAEKYKESLDFLTGKLEQMPDDTSLRYARALVAEKVGELELAEKDLLVIIEREPSNAQALNALGYTLADRTKRYDEALRYIERALAVEPEDAAIIDSMGWVQYRMGHHEKAVELLRRAMKLIKDPEVAAHLGEVLWDMGNKQSALDVWEEALQDHPNHKVLLEMMKRFGL